MSHAIESVKPRTTSVKEYGDFQTPVHLCNTISHQLKDIGFKPTVLLEPSCGKGNFIISALETFPSIKTVIAFEIQEEYKEEFFINLSQSTILNSDIKIIFIIKSFFVINLTKIFSENNIDSQKEKFLILGNPPWVTNSSLGQLNSKNIPHKTNRRSKLKSLDALTGKSNFDIAETFITGLYDYFHNKDFLLAMICKTATSQSIIKNCYVNNYGFDYRSFLFDAKRDFGISAQANVFVIAKSDQTYRSELSCAVYDLHDNTNLLYTFGYKNGKFVSNIDLYEQCKSLEGDFMHQWRQGLKHDASSVLVLEKISPGLYKNKLHEIIELEDDLIYPFLKSSDIKGPIISESKYFVLLTQEKLGQDFTPILQQYPKTWSYLQSHKTYFEKRKSKIYNKHGSFCLFGIGDYSFKKFKIAVSGLYKILQFSMVFSNKIKTIMVDDTCYTLSFDSLDEAVANWILLQTEQAKNYFKSIVFLESKRPYKKENLQRLDLINLSRMISDQEIKSIFVKLPFIDNNISIDSILKYKQKLSINEKINTDL